MTVQLPTWLPPVVVTCVVGHFPVADEDAMRRAGDYWSDKAEWCREQAGYLEAMAAQRHADIEGRAGDALEESYRKAVANLRAQADYNDQLAEQLYDGANSLELQKWTVIGFAVILAWTLAHAAIMFAAGGAIEAYLATMRTKAGLQIATRKLLEYLAMRGAGFSAERGTLVLARNAAFFGVLQGGGINAGAQLKQVQDGHRESMDWRSAGIAAAAGGVGNLVGAGVGQWVGGRWIIPATVPFAERAGRIAERVAGHGGPTIGRVAGKVGRVGGQVGGTAMVGGVAGFAGGIAGVGVSLTLSGEGFTREAFIEGMIPGVTSGFLGAAGHAARSIRDTAHPQPLTGARSDLPQSSDVPSKPPTTAAPAGPATPRRPRSTDGSSTPPGQSAALAEPVQGPSGNSAPSSAPKSAGTASKPRAETADESGPASEPAHSDPKAEPESAAQPSGKPETEPETAPEHTRDSAVGNASLSGPEQLNRSLPLVGPGDSPRAGAETSNSPPHPADSEPAGARPHPDGLLEPQQSAPRHAIAPDEKHTPSTRPRTDSVGPDASRKLPAEPDAQPQQPRTETDNEPQPPSAETDNEPPAPHTHTEPQQPVSSPVATGEGNATRARAEPPAPIHRPAGGGTPQTRPDPTRQAEPPWQGHERRQSVVSAPDAQRRAQPTSRGADLPQSSDGASKPPIAAKSADAAAPKAPEGQSAPLEPARSGASDKPHSAESAAESPAPPMARMSADESGAPPKRQPDAVDGPASTTNTGSHEVPVARGSADNAPAEPATAAQPARDGADAPHEGRPPSETESATADRSPEIPGEEHDSGTAPAPKSTDEEQAGSRRTEDPDTSVQRHVAEEKQRTEAVREQQQRRVSEAAEREKAARAELQRRERAAEEAERATRGSITQRARDLLTRSHEERAEAARTAREHARQAQADLAESRTAYEAAVAEHDTALAAVARESVAMSDTAGTVLMEKFEAGVLTDREAVFEAVAKERVRAALDAARAIGGQREVAAAREGGNPMETAAPEQLATTIARGSEAEQVAAMTEWIRRGDDRHRLARETQVAAFLVMKHGPVDMKTGEGKTLVMVMRLVADAADHDTAHAWTSSDLLSGELVEELQHFLDRPGTDLGIDVYRIDQDNPLPESAPGRRRIVVGTGQDYMFRALKVADSMLVKLEAEGAAPAEVRTLRDWMNTKPSIDEIKVRLDAAAREHGLDDRFDPFPPGKHTIDELDSIFDGSTECVLSPGAAERATPETRAMLEQIWKRMEIAEREHGLTARDFGRQDNTRGMWASITTPSALEKLNRAPGDPVTPAEMKHFANAANARWGVEKGTHYIKVVEPNGEGKIGILASETNDKPMWNREKSTDVRWQDVGQFVDLKEGVPVLANQKHSLTMSDRQLIGSEMMFDFSGLSGTAKDVESALYARYGSGPVAEIPTFYTSQRDISDPLWSENTQTKLERLARDIVADAKIVPGKGTDDPQWQQTGNPQWVVCMDNGEIRGNPETGRMGLLDWIDKVGKEQYGDNFELKFEVVDADFYGEHGGSNANSEALARQKIKEFGEPGSIYITNKDGGRGADPTPTEESVALGGVVEKVSGGPAYSPRVNTQVDGRVARSGSGDDRDTGGTPGSVVHYISPEDFWGPVADPGVVKQVIQYQNAVAEVHTAAAKHQAENTPATLAKLDQAEAALHNAETTLRDKTVPAMQNAVEKNLLASRDPSTYRAHAPPDDPHSTAPQRPAHPPPQTADTTPSPTLPAGAAAASSTAVTPATLSEQPTVLPGDHEGLAGNGPAAMPQQARDGYAAAAEALQRQFGPGTLAHAYARLGVDQDNGTPAEPVRRLAETISSAAFRAAQLDGWQIPEDREIDHWLRDQTHNVLIAGFMDLDRATVQRLLESIQALRQGNDLTEDHTDAIEKLTRSVQARYSAGGPAPQPPLSDEQNPNDPQPTIEDTSDETGTVTDARLPDASSTSGNSTPHHTPWTARSHTSPVLATHDVPAPPGTAPGSLPAAQQPAEADSPVEQVLGSEFDAPESIVLHAGETARPGPMVLSPAAEQVLRHGTIAEIAAWLHNEFGFAVRFDDPHADRDAIAAYARALAEELSLHAHQAWIDPAIVVSVGSTTKYSRRGEHVYAITRLGSVQESTHSGLRRRHRVREIRLSQELARNPMRHLATWAAETGRIPRDTADMIREIVRHEVGHALASVQKNRTEQEVKYLLTRLYADQSPGLDRSAWLYEQFGPSCFDAGTFQIAEAIAESYAAVGRGDATTAQHHVYRLALANPGRATRSTKLSRRHCAHHRAAMPTRSRSTTLDRHTRTQPTGPARAVDQPTHPSGDLVLAMRGHADSEGPSDLPDPPSRTELEAPSERPSSEARARYGNPVDPSDGAQVVRAILDSPSVPVRWHQGGAQLPDDVLLASAADTDIDLEVIRGRWEVLAADYLRSGWRVGGGLLFRGDTRPGTELWDQGLLPLVQRDGSVVYTTVRVNRAADYGEAVAVDRATSDAVVVHRIHVVDAPGGFGVVDENGGVVSVHWPGGLRGERIMGCFEIPAAVWHGDFAALADELPQYWQPNPGYRPHAGHADVSIPEAGPEIAVQSAPPAQLLVTGPESVVQARRYVRELVRDWASEQVRNAELLVSEQGARLMDAGNVGLLNAEVTGIRGARVLRVEAVGNATESKSAIRAGETVHREWAVELLTALAQRSGRHTAGGFETLWFELEEAAPAAEVPSPETQPGNTPSSGPRAEAPAHAARSHEDPAADNHSPMSATPRGVRDRIAAEAAEPGRGSTPWGGRSRAVPAPTDSVSARTPDIALPAGTAPDATQVSPPAEQFGPADHTITDGTAAHPPTAPHYAPLADPAKLARRTAREHRWADLFDDVVDRLNRERARHGLDTVTVRDPFEPRRLQPLTMSLSLLLADMPQPLPDELNTAIDQLQQLTDHIRADDAGGAQQLHNTLETCQIRTEHQPDDNTTENHNTRTGVLRRYGIACAPAIAHLLNDLFHAVRSAAPALAHPVRVAGIPRVDIEDHRTPATALSYLLGGHARHAGHGVAGHHYIQARLYGARDGQPVTEQQKLDNHGRVAVVYDAYTDNYDHAHAYIVVNYKGKLWILDPIHNSHPVEFDPSKAAHNDRTHHGDRVGTVSHSRILEFDSHGNPVDPIVTDYTQPLSEPPTQAAPRMLPLLGKGEPNSDEDSVSIRELLRRNRPFTQVFAGNMATIVGNAVQGAALPLLMFQLTKSPEAAGWTVFATHTPSLLFGIPAGVVADRSDVRRMMRISEGAGLLAAGTGVVAVAAGSPELGAVLAMTTFLERTATTFYVVGNKTAVKLLTTTPQRRSASHLTEGELYIADLAGKAAGPILMGVAPWLPFAVNTASYAANLGMLSKTRGDFPARQREDSTSLDEKPGSIREGGRVIWKDTTLRTLTLGTAFSNAAFAALNLRTAAVVSEMPHWTGGLVLTSVASGGVVGAILSKILPEVWFDRSIDNLYPAALLTYTGLGLSMAAGTNPLVLAASGFGVSALGIGMNVSTTNYQMNAIPDEIYGSALGAKNIITTSGLAAGGLLGGYLLAETGVGTAGWVEAAALGTVAAGSLVASVYKRLRQRFRSSVADPDQQLSEDASPADTAPEATPEFPTVEPAAADNPTVRDTTPGAAARRRDDCITRVAQALFALGNDEAREVDNGRKDRRALETAIAAQLIEVEPGPDTDDPLASVVDDIQHRRDGADTAVIVVDDGTKAHSYVITNIDDTVVVFDTNIAGAAPRVRTLDRWKQSYPHIEEAFVAYFGNKQGTLSALHEPVPDHADRPHPRHDIEGPPANPADRDGTEQNPGTPPNLPPEHHGPLPTFVTRLRAALGWNRADTPSEQNRPRPTPWSRTDRMIREAVVVGSGAIDLALGRETQSRPPKDGSRKIEIAVSRKAFQYLRRQPGWSKRRSAEGEPTLLERDALIVGTRLGEGLSHPELAGHTRVTPDGVRFASLPYEYARMHQNGSARDMAEMERIRHRLLDPNREPLPDHVIAREIELVRSTLPKKSFENLSPEDHEKVERAVRLAANGLHIAYTLYGGHPDMLRDGEITVNQIIGALEKADHGTLATYHNGAGTLVDMVILQKHLDNLVAEGKLITLQDRLDAMVGEVYSDSVYGNGRRSDNPDSFDELRSALLVEAHALARGYTPERAARLRRIVLGTTFREGVGTQAGRDDPDYIVQAVAGIDLQTLSEPDAVVDACHLAVEDNMSARYSPDLILSRAAEQKGVRLRSFEEALQFIDTYPAMRPIMDNGELSEMTVKEAFSKRLLGNAGFMDPDSGKGYRYPPTWTLENVPMRRDHRDFIRSTAARLLEAFGTPGFLTAVEFYEKTKEHAAEMRRKYHQEDNPGQNTSADQRTVPAHPAEEQGIPRDVPDSVRNLPGAASSAWSPDTGELIADHLGSVPPPYPPWVGRVVELESPPESWPGGRTGPDDRLEQNLRRQREVTEHPHQEESPPNAPIPDYDENDPYVLREGYQYVEVSDPQLGRGIMPVTANHRLDELPDTIEEVVIVVHGCLRNADTYLDAYIQARGRYDPAKILVIAPQFPTPNDLAALEGASSDPRFLRWGMHDWRHGEPAQYPSAPVSSFQPVFSLAYHCWNRCPDIRQLTVIGNSEGGQYTHRLGYLASVFQPLVDEGITVPLIASNPGAVQTLYRSIPDASTYPNYANRDYGLDQLHRFRSIGPEHPAARSPFGPENLPPIWLEVFAGLAPDWNGQVKKACEAMIRHVLFCVGAEEILSEDATDEEKLNAANASLPWEEGAVAQGVHRPARVRGLLDQLTWKILTGELDPGAALKLVIPPTGHSGGSVIELLLDPIPMDPVAWPSPLEFSLIKELFSRDEERLNSDADPVRIAGLPGVNYDLISPWRLVIHQRRDFDGA